MKRRSFLKSAAIATAPLMLNHIPVMASAEMESINLNILANAALECGKILVIVQMNGGNDGLNMVFPKDKWRQLAASRSNILINESNVLSLNNNTTTGLHPAMPEMQSLYNEGKLLIVQGVSYPNPSYSHFRATDIWFTGSSSNETLNTGWLGRSLNTIYPNFPNGYPNASMPDPLAIQIGSTLPFMLQGPTINMGYSVPKPEDLLNVVNATVDPAPNTDYGLELTFLRLMKDQSNAYRGTIQNAYNFPMPDGATYPTSNRLADQLKIVAKLINGGLKTPIYIVNHPDGFDTHESQVNTTDKLTGKQPRNLTKLSKAIAAFQQDLKIIGKEEKVTGMTFSEFGRRIKSNDSGGTDHGAGAPVMFFGAALNTGTRQIAGTAHPISGMIGKSPEIPDNATVDDQVDMQFDFRQIYATIMKDWLCMTDTQVTEVLGNSFETLPIFKKTFFDAANAQIDDNFIAIIPNPIQNNQLNLVFPGFVKGNIQVNVFNINGTKLYENSGYVNGDNFVVNFNISLSTGVYIAIIDYNGYTFKKKFLV
jgi:uncharacterized protein (DUF1501 family)